MRYKELAEINKNINFLSGQNLDTSNKNIYETPVSTRKGVQHH